MAIAQSILKARERGASDDLILNEILKQNPQKETTFTEARRRGASSTLILKEVLKQNPMFKSDVEPKEPKGFFERVGARFGERKGELGETFRQTVAGEIDPASTGIQTVGKTIGFAGDIVGEGLVSLLRGVSKLTPDVIEDPIKQKAVDLLNTDEGEQALAAIQKGFDAWEGFKGEHPTAAKNLESIINITDILPIGRARKAVTELAETGLEKVAKVGVKTLGKTKESVKGVVGYGAAQVTGLNPRTIKTVVDNPAQVTDAVKKSLDRSTVAHKAQNAIDDRLDELSATGKEYNIIRETPGQITVPQKPLKEMLKSEYGINFVKNKVQVTKETVPLKAGDRKALNDFFGVFGDTESISHNAFLNARKSLDNMARWDVDKSDVSQKISKEIRKYYDDIGKEGVPGLRELDAKFAPEVKLLSKVKKEYLTADGELKDNALGKIANLTNRGNEQVLARLEKIVPGISEDINILKALEDVEYAAGQKVGTYQRAAVAIGAATTGNIPLVIGSVVASPKIAVDILKTYGRSKQGLGNIKIINNILRAFNRGKKLTADEADIVKKALLWKATGIQAPAQVLKEKIEEQE